ncbi:hypothetical protein INR49_026138 [Caranx melampygus]|nr:hypothetical protein INR49_026138 [Caranx melampygus]
MTCMPKRYKGGVRPRLTVESERDLGGKLDFQLGIRWLKTPTESPGVIILNFIAGVEAIEASDSKESAINHFNAKVAAWGQHLGRTVPGVSLGVVGLSGLQTGTAVKATNLGRRTLCTAESVMSIVASHGIDVPVQHCDAHIAATVVHGRHFLPAVGGQVKPAHAVEVLHPVKATYTVDIPAKESGDTPGMVEILQSGVCQRVKRALRTFTSLNAILPSKDWTQVSIPPPIHEGTVRKVMEIIHKWLEKTQAIDKETQKLSEAELRKVRQYAVDVTLDPNTAHRVLVISNDEKQVRCTDTWRNLPDNPERFSMKGNVLGRHGYSSGRFYYEVQVKGKSQWGLGVARQSVDRKADKPILRTSKPSSVGVFVDYEESLVSFYDTDAFTLIYSFTGCSFTEKLYPCLNPCFYDGDSFHYLAREEKRREEKRREKRREEKRREEKRREEKRNDFQSATRPVALRCAHLPPQKHISPTLRAPAVPALMLTVTPAMSTYDYSIVIVSFSSPLLDKKNKAFYMLTLCLQQRPLEPHLNEHVAMTQAACLSLGGSHVSGRQLTLFLHHTLPVSRTVIPCLSVSFTPITTPLSSDQVKGLLGLGHVLSDEAGVTECLTLTGQPLGQPLMDPSIYIHIHREAFSAAEVIVQWLFYMASSQVIAGVNGQTTNVL